MENQGFYELSCKTEVYNLLAAHQELYHLWIKLLVAASDYLIKGIQSKENKILRKIARAHPYTHNREIKQFLGHVDLSQIIQEIRARELRMLKEIVDTF